MKTLKEALDETLNEALFTKKNLDYFSQNPYGITSDQITGKAKGFPVGVVVKMFEYWNKYRQEPIFVDNLDRFYKSLRVMPDGIFTYAETPDGHEFWYKVIGKRDWKTFFDKYPEYEKYNE